MSKYPHNTWHGWGNSRLQPLCAHRLQEIVQGRPILYESLKKEVEFALHPQRFVFSCPLYDSQGNDWPLATIFTHVYVGDIADYARSKAELLENGKHALFRACGNWLTPRGNLRPEQIRRYESVPFPFVMVQAAAEYVWPKLSFLVRFPKLQAFNLVMNVVECALQLHWVLEAARTEQLPENWIPSLPQAESVSIEAESLLDTNRIRPVSEVDLGRFEHSDDFRYVVPLFRETTGFFVSFDDNLPELFRYAPAYFVSEIPTGWNIYFSDVRSPCARYVARGSGRVCENTTKILEKIRCHFLESLLSSTTISDFSCSEIFEVRLTPLTNSECRIFFRDLTDFFREGLCSVLANPRKNVSRHATIHERYLESKVWALLQEVLEVFFGKKWLWETCEAPIPCADPEFSELLRQA